MAEGKSSRTHTNIFEIVVDKNKYVFSVDSPNERAEWISMIKDITLPKQMKIVPASLQGNEYENGGLTSSAEILFKLLSIRDLNQSLVA